eukprot:9214673-Lingulodinium_polyedra.AAC.1
MNTTNNYLPLRNLGPNNSRLFPKVDPLVCVDIHALNVLVEAIRNARGLNCHRNAINVALV